MAKLTFKGFEEIEKLLRTEGERLHRNANSALKAGAQIAVEEMQKRIGTGPHTEHLKDSIAIFDMTYTKMGGYSMKIAPDGYREPDGEPFPKIAYALEYGTSKTKKKPWMQPAIKAKHKEIEEAMIKELMK